jgi:AcrR family transcriptional regulator
MRTSRSSWESPGRSLDLTRLRTKLEWLNMKKNSLSSSETRCRILEAAGAVFAEYGYPKATVRMICKRTGVNITLINYYFWGKEKLYLEVLKYGYKISTAKYPLEFGLSQDVHSEERLQNFIRLFLFRTCNKGKSAWFGKLITREMTEPTQALDWLVQEVIQPLNNILASIVRELVGDHIDEEKVHLCCASIIGLCLYYNGAKPFVTGLKKNNAPPERIEQVTRHIAQFSLSGLKQFAEGKNEKKEMKFIISNN